MTEDIQHIDVDSDEWENTPKALRDQVKKLQKAITDERDRSDGYRTKLTEKALGDVLAVQKFKNPTKVQRDLIDDGIDPLDGDAVKTWIEANAADYARGEGAPAAQQNSNQQDQHDAADYARLNLGAEFREPASVEKHEAVFAKITADMTQKDVEALFRREGI